MHAPTVTFDTTVFEYWQGCTPESTEAYAYTWEFEIGDDTVHFTGHWSEVKRIATMYATTHHVTTVKVIR